MLPKLACIDEKLCSAFLVKFPSIKSTFVGNLKICGIVVPVWRAVDFRSEKIFAVDFYVPWNMNNRDTDEKVQMTKIDIRSLRRTHMCMCVRERVIQFFLFSVFALCAAVYVFFLLFCRLSLLFVWWQSVRALSFAIFHFML